MGKTEETGSNPMSQLITPQANKSETSAAALPSGVLRTTFEGLAAAGVPYVVLRGYLPTAQLIHSPDIDVYAPPEYRHTTSSVLRELEWHERRNQTGRFPHRFFDRFGLSGRLMTVFDVVHGLYYGRRLYKLQDARRIVETSTVLDGIRVPNPWMALLTFALHVVLDKGAVSSENAARGRSIWDLCQNAPSDRSWLVAAYGLPTVEFAEDVARTINDSAVSDVSEYAARAVHLSTLRPHPALARLTLARSFLRARARRPVRIAFIGIDGAGKSTLVRQLVSTPAPVPIGHAYLGHNAFETRLTRWVLRRIEVLTDSGRSNSLRIRVLDKLFQAILPFDVIVRMLRAEWGCAIVAYDRHPAFQPMSGGGTARSIMGRMTAIYAKWWRRVVPQPDILVMCDGDPERLWARKKEHSLAVSLRSREELRGFYESFDGERHLIRTDQTLESSVTALIDALAGSSALRHRIGRATKVHEK